jgi:cytochrome c2
MQMYMCWLSVWVLVILAVVGYFTLRDGLGSGEPVWTVSASDPRQGRRAILKYGCSACHVIGGIRGATGRVGPKLKEIGEQIYIGGVVPNTPDNLMQWIRTPRDFSPETAMPELDVSGQDARDIAGYLYRQ